MRYYQPFHHTSQIWKIFRHQQTQETSSDKISAHQTVYNLKMLDSVPNVLFFFLLSTNKNTHSRQSLGIHFNIKTWDILSLSVHRCALDSEAFSYYSLESLKLGHEWWIKFQGNAFFIHLAADDTFSTLYCLSVLKKMLWFKHSKYSHKETYQLDRRGSEELGKRKPGIMGWGQGENEGSGRRGFREDNGSGGGILGFEGEKRMGREWSVWRTKTLEEQSNKIYGERDSCGPQKGEWTENY